jgi:hypothetical protein
MIGVKVREHDLPDVPGADADRAQLGAELLLGMYREVHRAPVERVPARVIPGFVDAPGFAGIDDDDPFVVLDGPGVDRQPL